jgi:hypothetical protein
VFCTCDPWYDKLYLIRSLCNDVHNVCFLIYLNCFVPCNNYDSLNQKVTVFVNVLIDITATCLLDVSTYIVCILSNYISYNTSSQRLSNIFVVVQLAPKKTGNEIWPNVNWKFDLSIYVSLCLYDSICTVFA